MPLFLMNYPVIDPVMVNLGPLPVRWYAMGYIVSLVAGWLIATRLVRSDALWGGAPRPAPESLDDLLVYVAFGAVLGGRIGYVLFYNLAFFLENPLEIPAVWKGGMSFHGGLAGATLGAWLFARREKIALPQRRRSLLAPWRPSACSWCASPISSSRSCGAARPTFPGPWFFPARGRCRAIRASSTRRVWKGSRSA